MKLNLHIMKILLHFLMIASKIGKRSESMITERKKKLPLIFTKIRTSTILHQRRIFGSCLLITVIVQIALCQQRLCFFSSVRS